jgi:hypothetical protein
MSAVPQAEKTAAEPEDAAAVKKLLKAGSTRAVWASMIEPSRTLAEISSTGGPPLPWWTC